MYSVVVHTGVNLDHVDCGTSPGGYQTAVVESKRTGMLCRQGPPLIFPPYFLWKRSTMYHEVMEDRRR